MNLGMQKYPEGECMSALQPGLKERLTRQRDSLRAQLDKIEGALKIMDEQPKVAEMFEALSKVC